MQSVAYGRCIASHVEDIQQHVCAQEFMAFKECVQKHVNHPSVAMLIAVEEKVVG